MQRLSTELQEQAQELSRNEGLMWELGRMSLDQPIARMHM